MPISIYFVRPVNILLTSTICTYYAYIKKYMKSCILLQVKWLPISEWEWQLLKQPPSYHLVLCSNITSLKVIPYSGKYNISYIFQLLSILFPCFTVWKTSSLVLIYHITLCFYSSPSYPQWVCPKTSQWMPELCT